jgi:putative chitinase
MLLTPDIIKQLCPRLPQQRAINLAAIVNEVCPIYGIVNADILHEFLARLLEECDEFTCYEENLNYRAERILETWPHRFKSIEDAKLYEHNPKKLAMKVYGSRKDLGNLSDEDGFTFRGSGPIQMTGRGNIVWFACWMKKKFSDEKSPEQWAELLRTSDVYGMHSACWLFAIAKQLIDEALANDLVAIVKKINGGLNGLDQTKKYYEKCKLLIK